jgi:ribosomal protein L20
MSRPRLTGRAGYTARVRRLHGLLRETQKILDQAKTLLGQAKKILDQAKTLLGQAKKILDQAKTLLGQANLKTRSAGFRIEKTPVYRLKIFFTKETNYE